MVITLGAAPKFTQLRIFQCLIETGSMTEAARRLNMTQPAISKQLALLESTLALKLFSRERGRPLRVTSDGIEFYKEVESTLSAFEQIPDIARRVRDKTPAVLRIGSTQSLMSAKPLLLSIRQMQALYPAVRLVIEAKHRLEVEESILRNQIDIGFAMLPSENTSVVNRTIIRTQAVAVVAAGHRLASRTAIHHRDLGEETVIWPCRQPLRTQLEAVIDWTSMHPEKLIECSSALARCQMAALGMGVAISDPFSADVLGPAIRVLAFQPEIHLSYGIFTHSRVETDEVSRRFIDIVSRNFRAMKLGE